MLGGVYEQFQLDLKGLRSRQWVEESMSLTFYKFRFPGTYLCAFEYFFCVHLQTDLKLQDLTSFSQVNKHDISFFGKRVSFVVPTLAKSVFLFIVFIFIVHCTTVRYVSIKESVGVYMFLVTCTIHRIHWNVSV